MQVETKQGAGYNAVLACVIQSYILKRWLNQTYSPLKSGLNHFVTSHGMIGAAFNIKDNLKMSGGC